MDHVKPDKYLVKGTFIDTISRENLRIRKGYLLIENGLIQEFSEKNQNESLYLYDYSGKLIIPGLSDLHLHAPQYSYIGTGMELELFDWLNKYTFPEESKYKDLEYAKTHYRFFVEDLLKSATTRASIFATSYVDSTLLLMDMLEEKKIYAYVEKQVETGMFQIIIQKKMAKKKQFVLLKNVLKKIINMLNQSLHLHLLFLVLIITWKN